MWVSVDKDDDMVWLWRDKPEIDRTGVYAAGDSGTLGSFDGCVFANPPEPGQCIEIEPIKLVAKRKRKAVQ